MQKQSVVIINGASCGSKPGIAKKMAAHSMRVALAELEYPAPAGESAFIDLPLCCLNFPEIKNNEKHLFLELEGVTAFKNFDAPFYNFYPKKYKEPQINVLVTPSRKWSDRARFV